MNDWIGKYIYDSFHKTSQGVGLRIVILKIFMQKKNHATVTKAVSVEGKMVYFVRVHKDSVEFFLALNKSQS